MQILLESWREFTKEVNEETKDTYGSEVVDQNQSRRKKGARALGLTREELDALVREELAAILGEDNEKPCKPSKGKRFAKRVDGKCRSFGQAGEAKSGGDRIRPGTKKGDAYCARSAKIKKCKNPPCANDLSRKKWKCQGSKSVAE